jgi:hypothetical protein
VFGACADVCNYTEELMVGNAAGVAGVAGVAEESLCIGFVQLHAFTQEANRRYGGYGRRIAVPWLLCNCMHLHTKQSNR